LLAKLSLNIAAAFVSPPDATRCFKAAVRVFSVTAIREAVGDHSRAICLYSNTSAASLGRFTRFVMTSFVGGLKVTKNAPFQSIIHLQ